MHLHLIQPKCLLLGGLPQAMPIHAKKPSVFMDVRSNRWSVNHRIYLVPKQKKKISVHSSGSRTCLCPTFLTNVNYIIFHYALGREL